MTTQFGWLRGLYFMVAVYLASSLKTGDLVVRFAVAVVLFFIVPLTFSIAGSRAKRASAA